VFATLWQPLLIFPISSLSNLLLLLLLLLPQVILPKDLSSQCCGMMFNSRGLKDAAVQKGTALEAALLEASQGGKIPIVCDTSPCLSQIKAGISEPGLRFALYEPVEFIRHFLVDKLEFSKVRGQVTLYSVHAVGR
jgi:D-lactate dehydrogenase